MEKKLLVAAALLMTSCAFISAQAPMKPEMSEFYEPVPPTVTPGTELKGGGFTAPSDAIVLFDGKDLSAWENSQGGPAEWKVKGGVMTVDKSKGDIRTKEKFESFQLHIEWRVPENIQGSSQSRGNSGVFLQGMYEIQILDNYNNKTYVNGQAGSVYKQTTPLANAMRKPGEWNVYDIIYTAPVFKEDGTYRIILVDTEGNEFGGDLLTVSSDVLITSGAGRTGAGKEWVMTGINMNKIASLTIGNQKVTEFSSRTPTEIVLTCPELEVGEYILTGTASDGSAVMFYSESGNTTETTVILSSSTVLWEGHHYVSWDLPDDNPNKKFDLIKKDVFATIKAGSVLSIHYSLEPDAEYHQIQTDTAWWTELPGTAKTDLTEDGIHAITLTREALDLIQAQDIAHQLDAK